MSTRDVLQSSLGPDAEDSLWELRLYVAGQTARSMAAFANLKRIAETHLHGRYRIEVIDLLVHPQLAEDDKIVAIPTLVRKLPPPLKKIVGDLSDAERTLVGLDFVPLPVRVEGPKKSP